MTGAESRADELWRSYLHRIGGREAYDREPGYRYQLDVLRHMVHTLSMILEDEAIPPPKAERILRCVLYGAPSVADAEQRIRDQQRMADLFSKVPLGPFAVENLGG